MTTPGTPAHAAEFYRQALVDLDRARQTLVESFGECMSTIQAIDAYRSEIKTALHQMGVVQ